MLQRTIRRIATTHTLCPHTWNGWLGVHGQAGLMGLSIGVGLGTGLQFPLYAPLLGDLLGSACVGSLFGILTFGYSLIGD